MAQRPRYDEIQARKIQSTRVNNMRRGLRQFLIGRPSAGRGRTSKRHKPARLVDQESSMRVNAHHLSRAATAPASIPVSSSIIPLNPPFSAFTPIDPHPITPHGVRGMHRSMSLPQPATEMPERPFFAVDPEEQYLAELAAQGRRRRSRRARHRKKKRGCSITWTDRRIKSRIITCCLSVLLLTIVLSTYLALTLSNRQESQEFHVLLIIIILVTTIFFCHSIISLCLLVISPSEDLRPRMSMIGPGGFANPPYPIPVAMARDEEAAGIESEVTKYPPPAYGLWRESVRVDPNRIFWQRNEAVSSLVRQELSDLEARPEVGFRRPPSYVSEDGVSYVIEAEPRSFASTASVPLPARSSEHGWA